MQILNQEVKIWRFREKVAQCDCDSGADFFPPGFVLVGFSDR